MPVKHLNRGKRLQIVAVGLDLQDFIKVILSRLTRSFSLLCFSVTKKTHKRNISPLRAPGNFQPALRRRLTLHFPLNFVSFIYYFIFIYFGCFHRMNIFPWMNIFDTEYSWSIRVRGRAAEDRNGDSIFISVSPPLAPPPLQR